MAIKTFPEDNDIACSEVVKLIADIAIAVFTAALVWATYVLANHTKVMSERDADRQRHDDLIRCIALAESIIRIDSGEYDRWTQGDKPVYPAEPFNELLALSKYIGDADTKRQLEYVTSVITSDLLSGTNSIHTNETFKKELEALRSRLPQAIIEMQRSLGNYVRK